MSTATAPVRLQLSRKRGFDLQAWSREVNGLPAVNVARPSKHGNPYRVGTCLIPDNQTAVEAFAANLPLGEEWIAPLRGNNLACWCALCANHQTGKAFELRCENCAPCHADTLGKLANALEAKAS